MGKLQKYVLAALCGLYVSPLWGADIPVKAFPAPAPYVNYDAFSGLYIGLNGGYGWNLGDASAAFSIVPLGTFKVAPQGFIGGLQAGYGWHINPLFYLGLEGDIDISTLDGTSTIPGFVGTADSKNKFMGSIRARVGFIPVGHAMIYGTVGYGFGSAEFTVTDFDGAIANVKPTTSGLVWGGGLEVPLSPNWLARIEYLQYDYGTMSATTPNGVTASAKDRVDLVRAGLSYKIGP